MQWLGKARAQKRVARMILFILPCAQGHPIAGEERKKEPPMPHAKKEKAAHDYPGGLTREEYYALPSAQRWLLAMRAKSDLLELWQTCSNKRCHRAHACQGDERCWLRPLEADLKNPNLGQPDFEFSYKYPKELDEAFVLLENLPHNPLLKPPVLQRRK